MSVKGINAKADAVIGKTPHAFFGQAEGERHFRNYLQCVESSQSFRYEELVANQWWSTTLNPLFDSDGNVYRIVGTAFNITKQKEATAALDKERYFLKTMLDNLVDGIVACDETGTLTLFNKATREFHGIHESHLPPEQWAEHFDLYHADGSTLMSMADIPLFRAFQGETVRDAELSIAPKRGKARNLLANSQAIFDDEGNKLGAVATMHDITDRKAAEAKLQRRIQRERRFNQLTSQLRSTLDVATIVESAVQTIAPLLEVDWCGFAWYCPDDDIPNWDVVTEVKKDTAESWHGAVPTSLVGPIDWVLSDQVVLRINNTEDYKEPIHKAFLQQTGFKSEMMLPLRLQSERLGIVICSTKHELRVWTDSEAELLKAVCDQLAIALDQAELYTQSQQKSTELEQTLQELQRTQMQMVQSEKMSSLGQLVAGVAHEINNPVNFIYGNLNHAGGYIQDLIDIIQLYGDTFPEPGDAIEALLENVELDFVTADLPKLLTSMKVGADRIRGIVSSLRTFSRMDEAEMKEVDLHDGLDSTLMILQSRLKARSDRPEIVIVKNYADLPQIECYAGQLNQVFMNLISNSIDALEDDWQQQTIDQPQISIRTHIDEDSVMIEIADNGPGMPEKVRRRIFDPFFTAKPVGKGTGMGLSISHQIVTEKHRGTFECHSQPSQGTQFVITIPCHQCHKRSSRL